MSSAEKLPNPECCQTRGTLLENDIKMACPTARTLMRSCHCSS